MNIKDLDNYYNVEEEDEEDEDYENNELVKQYMVKEQPEQIVTSLLLKNEEKKKTTRLKKEKKKEFKIQYEETKEKMIEKQEKIQIRNEIKFQPKIEEYLKMNFERKKGAKGFRLIKNPENLKRRKQIFGSYRETKETTELKKQPFIVFDQDGSEIPPFKYEEIKQISYFTMRSNYASVTYNDKIYIHGGTNRNQIYNDLISYDPNTNTFLSYSTLTFKKNSSPSQGTYNHQMVLIDNMFFIASSISIHLDFNIISGSKRKEEIFFFLIMFKS